MITIPIRASPLALASFAISLYKDNGYETQIVQSATMNERLPKIDRNGVDCMRGNTARMTWGIVSPRQTNTQWGILSEWYQRLSYQ